jgi:hypothetical protein
MNTQQEFEDLVHDKLPVSHNYACLRIEHDEDSSIPDDCSCGSEDKITVAANEYAEARVREIIGENEEDPHLAEIADNVPAFRRVNIRNALRAEQRARLSAGGKK